MKYLLPLLCASALFAQGETAQERGKRLIDETIAALGGKNFLSIQNRVEKGRAYSFYRDRMTGLAQATFYTQYVEAPDKPLEQRERQSFGKDEDYLILFLEDAGYQVTYRGAKPLLKERWERYVDATYRNIFYILRQRLQEPGLIIEHTGTDVWQNTPVEIVRITDADNEIVEVYLHRTTKLPVRQTYSKLDEKTKFRDSYSSIFSKYRDVGNGVQWPYNIIAFRNGDKTFEIFSETVLVNQPGLEVKFQLSPGTKVLPADDQ
jgi:hypothetical protein